MALEDVLGDPERYAALVGGRASPAEPIDARRFEILRDELRGHQRPRELAERIVRLEASLTTLYSEHRGTIDGREVSNNEIDAILRDSRDRVERRAAWDASKTIGPRASEQVRELARLRNEAARGLGFRDYFAMSLELQELDETWLFGMLDRVDMLLRDTWHEEKAAIDDAQRARIGIPTGERARAVGLRRARSSRTRRSSTATRSRRRSPTSIRWPSRAPTSARSATRSRGSSSAAISTRARARASTRSASRSTAATTCASSRTSSRASAGSGRCCTSSGTACTTSRSSATCPGCCAAQAHIFATEAIAMLHGRRTRDRSSSRLLRAPARGRAIRSTRAFIRRTLHVLAAWVQVMTRFERALYADPDGDLGTIWWDLVERYQLVTRPEGPRPDDWATKLHIALAPVYYHNYLLGEITASQLEWALERETGSASPAGDPARRARSCATASCASARRALGRADRAGDRVAARARPLRRAAAAAAAREISAAASCARSSSASSSGSSATGP